MTWRPGTHASDASTLRYRGTGRRGRPSGVRSAVVDLQHAIESLGRARHLLEQVPTGDRRAREAVLAEARREAELGQRFARHVVRQLGKRPKPPALRPRQLVLFTSGGR